MESRPLSERLNTKKLALILWAAWSLIGILILSGEVGAKLFTGNFLWDLIIVLAWIASGLPVVGFVVVCFSVIWLIFSSLKKWLFDK